MIIVFEVLVIIAFLLYISNIEISFKEGFRIYFHSWWKGLGVFFILIGLVIFLTGEKLKDKKSYEIGYKEGIEEGYKKGSEAAFNEIRKNFSKSEQKEN